MPAVAIQRLTEQTKNTPAPARPPRIPHRVRHAVELILTGACSTQKAAAERAGITPEWLSKALRNPATQAFIARRTRETIATGQMRASARLVELVDASSEHVSLDASKHVLAIAGIAPADSGRGAVNVNVNIAPGYVLDLRDSPPTVDVTPDVGSDVGSE